MTCLRDVAAACIEDVYPSGSCLFKPELLAELYEQISSLPASLRWAGFECRLAANCPRVDFGVSVDRAQAERILVPGSEALCQRMLRNWLVLEAPLRALVWRATIEIDRPTTPRNHASSVHPLWSSAFAFFRIALAGGPELAPALTELLSTLRSEPARSYRAKQIERALPRGSQVLHVTALDHRDVQETRVHFAVHCDYLPTLCRTIEPRCRESARLLRTLIADIPVGGLAIQSVSRDGEFLPYSVELLVPNGSRADSTWRTLLSRLRLAAVASAEKVEAVLAWPGTSFHEDFNARIDRGFYVSVQLAEHPSAKVYPYFHWSHVQPGVKQCRGTKSRKLVSKA